MMATNHMIRKEQDGTEWRHSVRTAHAVYQFDLGQPFLRRERPPADTEKAIAARSAVTTLADVLLRDRMVTLEVRDLSKDERRPRIEYHWMVDVVMPDRDQSWFEREKLKAAIQTKREAADFVFALATRHEEDRRYSHSSCAGEIAFALRQAAETIRREADDMVKEFKSRFVAGRQTADWLKQFDADFGSESWFERG